MDEADVNTRFELELFVIGRSPRAEEAIRNLRWLCETVLKGRCDVTVIDVLQDPAAAETANIVATPTLIRKSPAPRRRIVGDLSMTSVLLRGLGIDVERGEGKANRERSDDE